jgi:hypothetical protein
VLFFEADVPEGAPVGRRPRRLEEDDAV